MEFDLARFRDVKDGSQFISIIEHVCATTLTTDFWKVTLPNDLATSSSISPSLSAFLASLVLLDARALFSKVRVSDFLDPALQAHRSAVERHHLFPKGYLKTLNIVSPRDTNQIANYALVEWEDNSEMSDRSPTEYLPAMKARFNPDDLSRMYQWHALPDNWEQMEYRTFLEKRRELIAQVIAKGYQTLVAGPEEERTPPEFDLSRVIANGESEALEFKSTLRTNLHTGNKDPRMELSVLKTIAGFLNTSGGTLIIGLSDDRTPIGIEADGFQNEDKMSLHLVNLVKSRMGPQAMISIHPHFEDFDGGRVMVAKCSKAALATFVKDNEIERFYVRMGPSTEELSASQTQEYIGHRFKL